MEPEPEMINSSLQFVAITVAGKKIVLAVKPLMWKFVITGTTKTYCACTVRNTTPWDP
jgi:hypothetical protein